MKLVYAQEYNFRLGSYATFSASTDRSFVECMRAFARRLAAMLWHRLAPWTTSRSIPLQTGSWPC